MVLSYLNYVTISYLGAPLILLFRLLWTSYAATEGVTAVKHNSVKPDNLSMLGRTSGCRKGRALEFWKFLGVRSN